MVGPSGDCTGESGVSGTSGEACGSGFQVTFSGHEDRDRSREGLVSGGPHEAGEGSTVTFPYGRPGSGASASGEGPEEQHPSFSGFPSGLGSASGSGDISGSGGESVIIMVDRKMVDLSETHQKPTEQEFGRGGIDFHRVSSGTDMSGSGIVSGSGTSGFISGDHSGTTYGSGFPSISFVDHGLVDRTDQTDRTDRTDQPSVEQEVSGYHPTGSGIISGFPSGFPSSVSVSGTASGDTSQTHRDVIYLTDDDMMEVTVQPFDRHPEQGRGVVEMSGEGSGSGIHSEFGSTLDQTHHWPSSASSHEELTSEGLSVDLPPGTTATYPEYMTSVTQTGFEEELEVETEQEGRAGPTEEIYVTTGTAAYTSPTTAPSVSLATPSVVEPPTVVEGVWFRGKLW